jgi:hypothetical protein
MAFPQLNMILIKNSFGKKRGMDSIFINDIRQDLQDHLDI